MTTDYHNSEVEFLPSKSDAAADGARLVEIYHDSARSFVTFCTLLKEVLWRHRSDLSAIDKILEHLVRGRVLSAAEARLGRASPKLSKFCKIGENADILLNAKVLPRLSGAEYTILREPTVGHP